MYDLSDVGIFRLSSTISLIYESDISNVAPNKSESQCIEYAEKSLVEKTKFLSNQLPIYFQS